MQTCICTFHVQIASKSYNSPQSPLTSTEVGRAATDQNS